MFEQKFFQFGSALVYVGKQFEVLPGVYPELGFDGMRIGCIGLRDCGRGNFLLLCMSVDKVKGKPHVLCLEPMDLEMWVRQVEKVADAN